MFLSKRVAATQGTWSLLALQSSRLRLLHSSPDVATPSTLLKSDKFIFDKHVNTIQDIPGNYESLRDKTVTLNGWIDKKPKKIGKGLIFATLRDIEGNKIQLVGTESLLKGLNTEDVVQVQGRVNIKRAPLRGPAGSDSTTAVEEYEVKLSNSRLLNKANEKPAQLYDKKLNGNYPPEYRVLQLRLPEQQETLRRRYEVTKYMRDLLHDEHFVEIETPILFKPTPEGAREFLVPTRSGAFYALTQSPQQYKQLLMASGVPRYFQFARCFRDEDNRKDRQPEFTQMDMEMSFANGEDVMNVIENLITKTWAKFGPLRDTQLMTLNKSGQLVPLEHGTKIYRMTYREAMTKYGIDKPDLRAPDLQIMSLNEFKVYAHENIDFPNFEVLILRNVVESQKDYEKNWSYLVRRENYNNRTPIAVPILSEESVHTWFEQFYPMATFENPVILTKFLNLKKGDIVFGCSREPDTLIFENPTPLGRLRQLLLNSNRGRELFFRTNNDVATWVVDFPLFSPVVEEETGTKSPAFPIYKPGELTSTHHPFTMAKIEDYEYITKNPIMCKGQHYDFVLNGVEIGGGSTRVHDPELQNYIFKHILKIDNAEALFGHLLEGLAMGCPPHAGFAIGFDRMCSLLFDKQSIRDVLAFPKSITSVDLVVKSPAFVKEDVIRPYNLKFLDPSKNKA